ncbi:MAG TPA: porphobilinogen synthase, partial [Pirellulales bacterium]|nr:porphobilinogen synthase [Pirellulales bacterium]
MAKCESPFGSFPTTRMRRVRRYDWARRMVAEHSLSVDDLIWPLFIHEGTNHRVPIDSMPHVDRLSIDLMLEAAKEACALGIPAIALFPATDANLKTEEGREAVNPENLICRAVR